LVCGATTTTDQPKIHADQPFVGERLGEFVAASSWQSIPEVLRHEARRALLNYFACAFGSALDPTVDTAVKLMLPATGERAVTVIGRREQLEPMGAAFVNAISANLLDYDDTHWNTAIHAIGTVAACCSASASLPACCSIRSSWWWPSWACWYGRRC